MNLFIVSGRIGKDPELKTVNEKQLLKWSMAFDTGWGDKKKTHWINCSLWGKQATAMFDIFKKGMPLTIGGELSMSEWTDKNGVVKTGLEVSVSQFQLPPKQSSQPSSQATPEDYV
jgi:single-strand DNA-binding protein